jgi:H+/Cl- antiporter ClcA
MASGMSLGPELPLVLTGGMLGSMLGVMCRQSMLQARVMNLTAASGAIAGFFGFPMAGAMFVLEVPHRMGLQYFEALSPSTVSSIFAVLVNRMIVNNDVTGYYNYPFLTTTLPSRIFTTAIIYGVLGCGLGITYAEGVMYVKRVVHNFFHYHHHNHHHEKKEKDDARADGGDEAERNNGHEHALTARGEEAIPLVVHSDLKAHRTDDFFQRFGSNFNKVFSFGIKHEPTRAAVTGTVAGFIVGVICMFVPIVAFWGEAQLQPLIDKGRTALPILGGEGAKGTEDLIAYGYCLIDPEDPAAVAAGFSISCAALIASAKMFVTGVSLGTGIIAGHFWGPLFVGCAGSHLLTDLAILMQRRLGFGESLATYPCGKHLCVCVINYVRLHIS